MTFITGQIVVITCSFYFVSLIYLMKQDDYLIDVYFTMEFLVFILLCYGQLN